MLLEILALFAQADASGSWTDSTTFGFLGAGGGVCFSIWLSWYHVTKVLPEKDRQNAATVEKIEQRHADTIKTLTTEFHAALTETRREFRDDLNRLWEANHTGQNQTRDALNRLIEVIREGNHREAV